MSLFLSVTRSVTVVAALGLGSCTSSAVPDEVVAEPAVDDARPLAGSTGTGAPIGQPADADDHDPAHAHGEDTADDPAHAHGEDAAEAGDVSVASTELCGMLSLAGCALLPDQLSAAQVELVSWAATELAGARDAPDVVLGAAIVTCDLLDDLPYRDMVVLVDELNQGESDPSLALVYAMTPFVTPAAVTFLCPEHTESARADMSEVICAAATAQVCAAFEEDWLS